MSDWSDKLSVAHNYMSWAAMSRETGLPKTVLNAIRTGARTPPSEYLPALRKIWSRTSYRWMNDVGVPNSQASRYRGGAFSTVKDLHDTAERVLHIMTEGAAMLRFAHLKQPWKSSTFRAYYDKIKPSILEGMKKSGNKVEYMPDAYGFLEKFIELNPGYVANY